MRSIPYKGHFATVLSLFTSFGYFDQDLENQAVFDAVYAALRPGGKYLVDYLSREYVISHLVAHDERFLGDNHVDNVRCLTDECRRVVKSGGILGLSVKEGSGETIDAGRLTVLWEIDELTRVVGDAGFRILSVSREPSRDGRDLVWINIIALAR